MLFDFLNALKMGDASFLKEAFASLLLSLPIIILALSVHETAHGYVASKLGDPTARYMGRLSLNPLRHLDPFGFLAMLCFGFGWAKPVPVNSRYFKKPRRDMAICAIAGPISNILLAFIFALLLRLFLMLVNANIYSIAESDMLVSLVKAVIELLRIGVVLNISLAVFNLFPIPPLDGSKVLYMFLPPNTYFKVLQYERYITYGFFLFLMLESFMPISIISPIVNTVSNGIIDFFNLILFF